MIVDATKDTSERWLAEHNLRFDGSSCLRTPMDTGQKTALARELLRLFPVSGTVLILVREWGIWPSSENPNLFKFLRQSFGLSASLVDCPGTFLDLQDRAEIECLLDAILFSYWSATVMDANESVKLEISHDEMITIHWKAEFGESAQLLEGRWPANIAKQTPRIQPGA